MSLPKDAEHVETQSVEGLYVQHHDDDTVSVTRGDPGAGRLVTLDKDQAKALAKALTTKPKTPDDK
jgi:hypothetical protein